MNGRMKIGVVCAIAAVCVAGIILVVGPDADSQTVPPDNSPEDGGKALQEASVSILPGQFSDTESNHTAMKLRIDIRIRGHDKIDYQNVQLCAYTENGTLLQNKTIGDITTDPPQEFVSVYEPRLTVPTRPKYIIVDHPRLRNDSRFHMDTRYWEEDGYRLSHKNLGEIQDRFEWPSNSEIGKCG